MTSKTVFLAISLDYVTEQTYIAQKEHENEIRHDSYLLRPGTITATHFSPEYEIPLILRI